MILRSLDPHLPDQRAQLLDLLLQALPHDPQVARVAEEKLFGDNGARSGQTLGAFSGEDAGAALLGVMAQAGRWIKVLAVAPAARRRGVGRRLVGAARAWLAQSQPERKLRIGDHPGNYLTPGVDQRYAEAPPFLAALGFRCVGEVLNLRAPLPNPLVTAARADQLRDQALGRGYRVRRAGPADVEPLLKMVREGFSAVWAHEVRRALGEAPGCAPLPEGPAVHVAERLESGALVAFAAHDGNNRGLGWFGPMGTLPAHRGQGLGEALLLPCLLDVQGRPEGGVIAWVGPVDFYARACGALADRRFSLYEEG